MARGRQYISGWQMLGIVLICAVLGLGLGCLYVIHPILLAAGIALLCIIWVLIRSARNRKKQPALLAVLGAIFVVTAGLGLYLGMVDPSVSGARIMADERITAALDAAGVDGPSDGTVTPGPYLILRRRNEDSKYTIIYRSERQTRSMMDKLQTVIIVSDYQTIDSGEYILKLGNKQAGESTTFEQYRLRLRYFDIEKQEIVRTDIVDGEPLNENGGGGLIPDSAIIKAVKDTMKQM